MVYKREVVVRWSNSDVRRAGKQLRRGKWMLETTDLICWIKNLRNKLDLSFVKHTSQAVKKNHWNK